MKRTMRLPVAEADSTTGHPRKALKTTKQQQPQQQQQEQSTIQLQLQSDPVIVPPKAVKEYTSSTPSKNENLLQKLILGIESNDMDVVASVFNDRVERNVMRDLPLPLVMPLLKLIRKKVARKSVKSIHHLDWLESLIHCKLSYLLSCQNIDLEIGYLLDSLNVKVDVFDRVIQLQGKLDLLMAQVNSNENTSVSMQNANSSITKMKAKIAYRDPDESESEVDDDDEQMANEDENDEENEKESEDMDMVSHEGTTGENNIRPAW